MVKASEQLLTLIIILYLFCWIGSDEELKRVLAEFKEKLEDRELKLAEVREARCF